MINFESNRRPLDRHLSVHFVRDPSPLPLFTPRGIAETDHFVSFSLALFPRPCLSRCRYSDTKDRTRLSTHPLGSSVDGECIINPSN